MNAPIYVDVILPLALRFPLTYSVDAETAGRLRVGMRAVVPLKGGKLYTGLIWRIHYEAPTEYEVRPIAELLDTEPVILPVMQTFWEKMASYYMSTLGEVMTAALPAGLKLESKTRFTLNKEADIDHASLSDREYLLVEAMETQGSISVEDAEKILGLKQVRKYLKGLVDKGCIAPQQEMEERYRPLKKKKYRLAKRYRLDDNLKKAMDGMTRAAKQTEMLSHFLILSGHFTGEEKPVARESLLSGNAQGATALKALVKKGILEEFEEEEFRIKLGETDTGKNLPELTPKQTEAIAQSRAFFTDGKPVLLFGITGSGKTEIYIHLIREALDKGKQVLFLLPEIALTTQLIGRIKRIFPGRVGVYHSKFSENERVEVWNRVLHRNGFDIVLGARSALFLPFSDLGLIVVDEEHEHSFKQYDPAPRYHARDFALVLAGLHEASVMLGSATPSLESYHNAMNRKYGLVRLEERFGQSVLPEITPVNLAEARKKNEVRTHFTLALLEAMKKAIIQKQQAILFRNRRGFSLLLECRDCGHVPQCKQCDISLTYHKAIHQLRCRYCGYMAQVPARCGACGGTSLEMQGYGTEKIEEELNLLYPDWRIARLDLDTASRKNAYARILGDFEEKQTDVLVGTQMVSKGLDFDHVAIVGILHADEMLSIPDFRSNERAFQLMTQVAGRSGRRDKKGLVILQTYKPEHYVVRHVVEHDVTRFLNEEAHHRHNLGYPPFTKLIRITLRHTDKTYAQSAAEALARDLRQMFKERVLGPEQPGVGRVRNKYLFDLLLKFKPTENLNKAKLLILQATDRLHGNPSYRSAEVLFDVDPY